MKNFIAFTAEFNSPMGKDMDISETIQFLF
jgi:hypothetical protein